MGRRADGMKIGGYNIFLSSKDSYNFMGANMSSIIEIIIFSNIVGGQ